MYAFSSGCGPSNYFHPHNNSHRSKTSPDGFAAGKKYACIIYREVFRSSNLNVIPRADPVVVAARAVPVHRDAAADELLVLLRVAVLSVTKMML